MPIEVLILHATGEDAHAITLADSIRGFGYDAWHTGDLLVGEQIASEVSRRILSGAPIVICGTMRAAGSKWVKMILGAVQQPATHGIVRVFPVRLEAEADLESVGFSVAIAECCPMYESGIEQLKGGLSKHFPIDANRDDVAQNDIATEERRHRFDGWLTNVTDYSSRILRQYRDMLRPEIRHLLHDDLSDKDFFLIANVMKKDRFFATGILLFHEHPQILVPKAFVQCVKYRGTTRSDLETSREIRGAVISQLEEAVRFVESHVDKVEVLRPGKAAADLEYQYPMACLREVIANAVCHRNYSDSKRHSNVRLYSNRIEVGSPGKWGSGRVKAGSTYTLSDLESEHVATNGRLADALRWVKLVETQGSGIPNAIADCTEKNAPLPTVELRDGMIVVTVFPRHQWNQEAIARRSATSRGTIFVSYRRDAAGKAFARLIERALSHRGYVVFLDVDSVEADRWEEQLRREVPMRAHFLLLLTPGALTHCVDDNDWVRREYELAVHHNRNVVPVCEESFDLDRERAACPASMQSVFDWQIATITHASFDRDIDELVSRFIPPHKTRPDSSAASGQSEPSSARSEPRIAASKLPAGAEVLIGRDAELDVLDRALEDRETHVVEFVAWGGVGKSALAVEWMTRRAAQDWPGIERYFDWSFYSQGTREQSAVSADQFIAEALAFFGDPDPQAGSPHDRGNRLAGLVALHPTLLILDEVEPLQYGTGPLKGQLKDPALLALLKGLAQRPFSGLCVVTTREGLTDLKAFHAKTVSSQMLEHLSESAGAALLHRSGATRRGAADIAADNDELRAASREVNGHALTLSLLGGYLKLAHHGDIERRDRVRFEKADEQTQGGHAFRVVAAYEQWLQAEVPAARGGDAEHGPRLLAVLRLLGLFDRPASADCLAALRREPAIAGLTDRLVALDEADWNIAVTSLVDLGLVWTDRGTLDAHPLLREYFALQLRDERSEAWTEGHRRLYEHLCEMTEHRPDGIDGLQPLYQAVAHGCQAGLHQQACDDVYIDRILRGTEHGGFYSSKKLGAIGADLGAVARFFDHPWSRLSPSLSAAAQAWLLNDAAYSLRALGRLTVAVEPMRAGLEMHVDQEEWQGAAISAGNLSELELTLGEVSAAIADAGQALTFADRSGDAFLRMAIRTTHADALHQAGRRDEARRLFVEAETMQAEDQAAYPRLYSVQGFQYCDLLLSGTERAAWRLQLESGLPPTRSELPSDDGGPEGELGQACDYVTERATQTLEGVEEQGWLLDIALDHLTLGRAALYRWLAEGPEPAESSDSGVLGPCPSALSHHLAAAVDGLRDAGVSHYLPRGLLTRAWQRQLTGDAAGAASDLDEAWEIAERGPMPLYQTDILLTRARLFFRADLDTARHNLAQARRLIEKHGYHRRDEELADAEAVILRGERQ